MFNPFINLSGSGNTDGVFIPKGTLDSINDLPQYQEGSESNPHPGWLYFVKTEDPEQLEEYVFTEEHKWEKLGYVPAATINGVKVEGDLDSREDLKIAGKVYYVDGVAKGEVFNYASNASGDGSHAEGAGTTASGANSHAEGGGTQAAGNHSHAEGGGTQAIGNESHAEGGGTQAIGINSHAEGAGTQAVGNHSHAEGGGTIAASDEQHVQGKYNIEDSANKYAFIIGNGRSNTARSNAFCVDWNGNIYVNNSSAGVNINSLSQRISSLESEPNITIDTQVNGNSTNPVQNSSIYNFVNSSVATNTAYFKGTFNTVEELNNVENPTNNDYAFIVETDDAGNTVYNRYKYNGTEWVFEYALNNSSFTANQWESINSGITAEDVEKIRVPATINGVDVTGTLDSVSDLKIAGKVYYKNGVAKGEVFNYASNASGDGSHAEGAITTATGEYSHAEGGSTIASGSCSHAEGAGSMAYGDSSHAEGNNTKANSFSSHAEGYSTTASGDNSHAEGNSTNIASTSITITDSTTIQDIEVARSSDPFSLAYGKSSHIEGKDSLALGENSHAEGWYTETIGINSHAEGSETIATGESSHAEGSLTNSLGNYSHAEGNQTVSQGSSSHAEGYQTHANSEYSHAEGEGTIAQSACQHVQGKYNIIDTNNRYAFIVGNGLSEANRSNAFAVDWSGNIYVNNVETGVNVNDLMPKSSIVKLNSMEEFDALTDKTAEFYFIKEG